MPTYARKLPQGITEHFASKQVPWGPIGYVVYKRTYARLIEDEGRTEEWHETLSRSIQGLLDIGGQFTEDELFRLFDYCYNLRMSFPGRGLWQLGTDNLFRVGSDSLQNCWVTSVDDPRSFCFAFNQLMLGGGVGFNITPEVVYSLPIVKHKPTVQRVDTYDCDFVVPDNRQGWVKLLGRILKAHFYTGRDLRYCTKGIRSKGEPIRTFGGKASGDNELVRGMSQIVTILQSRHLQKLRPVDCLDIMNIIGSIVVSGNVRRSAQLALGDPRDTEFMMAKNWASGKVPAWRGMSNNSVVASDASHLPDVFWNGYNGSGEPYGIINLDLLRHYGRLIDGKDYRPDPRVIGTNPCVTGDTWVQTSEGPQKVLDLLNTPFDAIVNGKVYPSSGFFKTGHKPVYCIQTQRGYSVKCTSDHLVKTTRGWVEAQQLTCDDEIVVDQSSCQWPGQWSGVSQAVLGEDEGWVVGNWLGDGYITNGQAVMKYWGHKTNCLGRSRQRVKDTVTTRSDFGTGDADMHSSASLLSLIESLGLLDKSICASVEKQGSDFYKGFIRGYFDADGCVVGDLNKGVSIRLASVNLNNLLAVQRMLARLGIVCTVYQRRKPAEQRDMPGGNYFCQELHELVITRDMCDTFMGLIGFDNEFQTDKYTSRITNRKRTPYRSKWVSRVVSVERLGVEDVYDATVPSAHCFNANGLIVHNCGEIGLENGEACCLSEQFICRIHEIDVWKDVAYLAYKLAKTISCHAPSDPVSKEVVDRNHRLGNSVTGVQQAYWWGPKHFDAVYRHIEQADEHYSKVLGVNKSIKLTTGKPSGTLSLLPEYDGGLLTPGVNDGFAEYQIRRVRFAADDPLIDVCRAHGYHVEPVRNLDGQEDFNTLVVSFPCRQKGGKQTSAIHQLKRHRLLQTYWADNAVSTTVYYRAEELDGIKAYLKRELPRSIKSVSFLLHDEHGFEQAPLEELTREQYEEMRAKTTPITSNVTTTGEIGSLECSSGACPIK